MDVHFSRVGRDADARGCARVERDADARGFSEVGRDAGARGFLRVGRSGIAKGRRSCGLTPESTTPATGDLPPQGRMRRAQAGNPSAPLFPRRSDYQPWPVPSARRSRAAGRHSLRGYASPREWLSTTRPLPAATLHVARSAYIREHPRFVDLRRAEQRQAPLAIADSRGRLGRHVGRCRLHEARISADPATWQPGLSPGW